MPLTDTHITANGKRIQLYNAMLSTGDSLELDQRFAHDATDTSQAITHRRRNTALAGTIRVSANASELAEDGISIFDYIRDVQELVGRLFRLTWYGREYPEFLAKSVQVSPVIDSAYTFSRVEMSISFVEGFVVKRTAQTIVRAL